MSGQAVPVTPDGQDSGWGRSTGSGIGRVTAPVAASGLGAAAVGGVAGGGLAAVLPATGSAAGIRVAVLAAGCAATAFARPACLPDGSELRAAVTRARRAAQR